MIKYSLKGLIIYTFESPIIGARTYCIIRENEGLLIDAVFSEELYEFLIKCKVDRITILLTHGHYDHILGIPKLKDSLSVTVATSVKGPIVLENPKKNLTAVANYISAIRKPDIKINVDPVSIYADFVMKDRTLYKWNEIGFKIIYTPGHSADSVCYLAENMYLFSGDTLLQHEKTILRFPGGNEMDYKLYTRPLLEALPKDLIVFPGHGNVFHISESIVFEEKKHDSDTVYR